MKTILKWSPAAAVAIMLLLQLTNPARTNPPVPPGHDLLATQPPPPEIVTHLRAACYDCHSQETRWPWYSRVAPMSWLVVDHVDEGRRRLNFSDWPHRDPRKAAKKWDRIGEEVSSGGMPLPSYTRIHSTARLTAAQREAIVRWAEQESQRLRSSATIEDEH